MIEWYCPFCKEVLEQKSDKDYWCKNCARLWKIILMEQYIKGKLVMESKGYD